jgi:hypothetical protein
MSKLAHEGAYESAELAHLMMAAGWRARRLQSLQPALHQLHE